MPVITDRSLLILVVAEDVPLRLHLRQLLEHEQYRVAEVSTFDEMMLRYDEFKPALVLVDFMMLEQRIPRIIS